MNQLLSSLLELFKRPSEVETTYFNTLVTSVLNRGGSVSDLVRVSGFPYQIIYRSQEMRYDN